MPVVIKPFQHAADPCQKTEFADDGDVLFIKSCPEEFLKLQSMVQSSFSQLSKEFNVLGSDNGFVRAALLAYNKHHHLIIRPEDVWFAILTQLSFYVNAHAEELRSFFVAHEGQKGLEVEADGVIFENGVSKIDYGRMAVKMTELIAANVNDPQLRTWIMPDFSTTTEADKVVAAILMMGAMQEYFTFTFSVRCGIPSVTLLGTKEDWLAMEKRLDMLPRLGSEAKQFAKLLKPVLKYMVRSFDHPNDSSIIKFWRTICHERPATCGMWHSAGYISGWITAFCFWNSKGECLYTNPKGLVSFKGRGSNPGCSLDGTLYHRIPTAYIPRGSAAVPVVLNFAGKMFQTRMVAGSVGIRVTKKDEDLPSALETNGVSGLLQFPGGLFRNSGTGRGPDRPSSSLDAVQPVSGWWMFVTKGDACCNKILPKSKKTIESPEAEANLGDNTSTVDDKEPLLEKEIADTKLGVEDLNHGQEPKLSAAVGQEVLVN